MKIFYTTTNKCLADGSTKTYKNYYLCLDSGKLIPIEVKFFEKKQYSYDITSLNAVSIPYENKKDNK